MDNNQPLNNDVVAMIALASGIAANHPAMGQCQLDRLRGSGVPENKIAAVIEIARHIRDEAAEKLDFAFDEKAASAKSAQSDAVAAGETCGCTPTRSGQSCC